MDFLIASTFSKAGAFFAASIKSLKKVVPANWLKLIICLSHGNSAEIVASFV